MHNHPHIIINPETHDRFSCENKNGCKGIQGNRNCNCKCHLSLMKTPQNKEEKKCIGHLYLKPGRSINPVMECEKCQKTWPTGDEPPFCEEVSPAPFKTPESEECKSFKSYFEANLLDGDPISDCGGSTLEVEFVFDTLAPFFRSEKLKSREEMREEITEVVLRFSARIPKEVLSKVLSAIKEK